MKICDFVITEDTTLVNIMKRLDLTGKGIVYVGDSENRLVGSITDGDIRRAIIESGRLDKLAREVMNKNPIFVRISDKEKAEIIMDEYVVRSVPLIDENNKIVGVRFDDDRDLRLCRGKNIDVPVVIMAGGKGTRLQPYTNILPKPLIPIGEKTITEHILDRFRTVGCSDFKVVINYKKHLIKAYFRDNDRKDNIEFIEEDDFWGTAGGLQLLIGKVKESFFVTNCDILLEADYSDIYEYHRRSKNIATIVCAIKNITLPYGVITTTESGRIVSIKEKPDISSIVNTGFYVLEPSFLEKIPKGRVSQITDIFQKCIDEGLRVGMYPVSEDCWMDMGQFDEMKKMEERLEDLR